MDTAEIVILIVLALLAALAVGGAIRIRRRMAATEAQFQARVEQANHDMAAAHAADKGWEPGRVEEAARRAFGERRPGAEIEAIALVQVIDNPGTDEDRAVFHVRAAGDEHTVTLGRRGDDWIPEG